MRDAAVENGVLELLSELTRGHAPEFRGGDRVRVRGEHMAIIAGVHLDDTYVAQCGMGGWGDGHTTEMGRP